MIADYPTADRWNSAKNLLHGPFHNLLDLNSLLIRTCRVKVDYDFVVHKAVHVNARVQQVPKRPFGAVGRERLKRGVLALREADIVANTPRQRGGLLPKLTVVEPRRALPVGH